MNQEPLSVLLLEPAIESVAALVEYLGKSAGVEMMPVPDAKEAEQAAMQFLPCLMIVSLRGSLDGAAQLELFTKLKKPIRSGQLKVLVVSSVKNHPLAKNIAAAGVTDYAEEPVTTKSLLFKTNLLLKAITALKKKSHHEEPIVFKAGERKKDLENAQLKEGVKMKPALQLGEDIFVFKGAQPRKIGKGYLVEAEGPLPESGKWEPLPIVEGEEPQWRWVSKPVEGEPEVPEGDGWVQAGERPIFDAKKGKWQFNSRRPKLAYVKKGKEVALKMATNERGEIEIAEDSLTAKENLLLNKTVAMQIERERRLRETTEREQTEEERKRKREEIQRLSDGKKKARNETLNEIDEKEAEASRVPPGELETEEEKSQRVKLGASPKLRAQPSTNTPALRLVPEKVGRSGGEEIDQPEKVRSKTRASLVEAEEKKAEQTADLNFREEALEGLKKEDLTGEQNLRDRMREDISLNLSAEKEKREKQIALEKVKARSVRNRVGELEAEEPGSTEGEVRVEAEEEALRERGESFAVPERVKGKARIRQELDPPLVRARKELKRLKEEAQLEAARALPEDLSEEQVALLRKKLRREGVEDSPRELSRLARLEKVKEIKRRMEQIQKAMDGDPEALEAALSALAAEEQEPSPLEREELAQRERNFRAIESIEGDSKDFFSPEKVRARKLQKKEEEPTSLSKGKKKERAGDILVPAEEVAKRREDGGLEPGQAVATTSVGAGPVESDDAAAQLKDTAEAESEKGEAPKSPSDDRGEKVDAKSMKVGELSPEPLGAVGREEEGPLLSGKVRRAELSATEEGGVDQRADATTELGKVERELEPEGLLGSVAVEVPESGGTGSLANSGEFSLGFRDLTVLAAMVDASRSASNEKKRMEKIANVARWAYPKLDFSAGWPSPAGLEPKTVHVLTQLTAALKRLA